jgi:hypothetical protein
MQPEKLNIKQWADFFLFPKLKTTKTEQNEQKIINFGLQII